MEMVGVARTSKPLGGFFEVGEGSKATEELALRNDEDAVVRSKISPESFLGSAEDRTLIRSDPWSVDWLQNIQHGDIGLISSKHKRLKMVRKNSGSRVEGLPPVVKRKKAGGVLRHPVMTLKKVARLPSTDREEVMKVLQGSKKLKVLHQKIRQRRRQRERVTRSLEVPHQSTKSQSTSSASVNNDWTNWVALNGSDESKAADIQAIGNTIDISFNGATHNSFSVLARSTGVSTGPVLTPVAVEEGVMDLVGGGAARVGVFLMKLVSWNVRGLGSFDKRREVRKLVEEKKPLILCLQETKLGVCDEKLTLLMWGDSNHAFSFRPSVGALGGLLTVWDTLEVEVL